MRHRACPFVLACCTALSLAGPPRSAWAQSIGAQSLEHQRPVSSESTESPSIRDIVDGAVTGFRLLPSHQTVSILTLGGVGALFGHSWDPQMSRAMSASSRLDGALAPGETLGGARMQLAAALGTYAIGRLADSPTAASIGADLIESQILAQVMTAGIKLSVGRNRPDGTQYSFPSGHSSATFATATVLQRRLGWKVGVPAYGLATYVAASRVQDKRHFFSDVTFGAAIGIVAGRSVTIGSGDKRFTIAPAPTPGGAAVRVTWVGKD